MRLGAKNAHWRRDARSNRIEKGIGPRPDLPGACGRPIADDERETRPKSVASVTKKSLSEEVAFRGVGLKKRPQPSPRKIGGNCRHRDGKTGGLAVE